MTGIGLLPFVIYLLGVLCMAQAADEKHSVVWRWSWVALGLVVIARGLFL